MLNEFMSFEAVLIISLISFVVTVPLSALALFISCKIFKQDIQYSKSIIPALIIGVIGLIFGLIIQITSNWIVAIIIAGFSFIVSLALYLTLPKLMFNLEWNKGIVVGIVWCGFMLVISLVIGVIAGIIAVAIGISMSVMG